MDVSSQPAAHWLKAQKPRWPVRLFAGTAIRPLSLLDADREESLRRIDE